jgi:drug/metabolite transporter (DMT)-like permease
MTYASVYQMLRGSVMLFTGIFSVIFLKRKLRLYHMTGMFLVLVGLALVGLASVMEGSSGSAPDPILGAIIVVCAQIIVAIQMVVEEKFLSKFTVNPLQVRIRHDLQ